jgi:hypothetical protein
MSKSKRIKNCKAKTPAITNINDDEFRTRMMKNVVKCVKADGSLHLPLLSIISCFIDGLAKAQPGEVGLTYKEYLKKHFPKLCKELGAEIFYCNFRCKSVHEFSIKKGFGIARDSELNGVYACRDKKSEIIFLNIDKLVDEFLSHIEKIE